MPSIFGTINDGFLAIGSKDVVPIGKIWVVGILRRAQHIAQEEEENNLETSDHRHLILERLRQAGSRD